jgi:hypothetical protein
MLHGCPGAKPHFLFTHFTWALVKPDIVQSDAVLQVLPAIIHVPLVLHTPGDAQSVLVVQVCPKVALQVPEEQAVPVIQSVSALQASPNFRLQCPTVVSHTRGLEQLASEVQLLEVVEAFFLSKKYHIRTPARIPRTITIAITVIVSVLSALGGTGGCL